jgi:outer membrane protein TolC
VSIVASTQFSKLLATFCLLVMALSAPAVCQQSEPAPPPAEIPRIDFSNTRAFPHIFAPYYAPFVPAPQLDNSRRLEDLIVDGKLTLTLDDAISLALENNLQIAVARYDLPIAQTDLLRAKAGGATRGVAGSPQSTTLFAGSLGGGVGGSARVGDVGAGGLLGGAINAVAPSHCCDPDLFVSYGWSNAITPLNYTVVSGVRVETTHQTAVSAAYSQGFLTGTGISVSEASTILSSNTTTGIFNPEFVSSLSAGFSQHLLKGFGVRANARFLRIARNDTKYSMSVFRQSVMAEVAAAMTTYYGLLSDQEKIRVAQEGLDYAQKLLDDNQATAKTGHASQPGAQYDALRSQEAVALRQQDLIEAQSTFSQDAQSLKAIISKSFNEQLATVEIFPSDRLPEPHPDDVPPLAESLRLAEAHRPEIEQAGLDLLNAQVAIQATRNALLPSLDVYASYSLSGLDGTMRPTFASVFENNFPNLSYGVTLDLPIRNRTAQADAARALLEQSRFQVKMQDAKNQAVWDVNKAVSAVTQARDSLDASLRLVKLAHQVVEMQQKKFTEALATAEEVITEQQNLSIAEGHVIRARATYAKALIQYEEATGTLLDRHHSALSEAVDGEVNRVPGVPGASDPTH